MNNTTDAEALLIAANDEKARTLIPAMAYLGLLMLLGIPGNMLVCFVFFFRLRMNTQNSLIIALAVFDLLSCFIAMPTEIVDMRYFLMFESEFACRLLRFIIHYCAFASILTLVVIAVDRYMKVCHPLQRQMSLKHVKGALLVVLVVALIFAFPALILYGIRTTELDNIPLPGHDCSSNDSVKETLYPLVYNTVLFVAFFFLLIVLTIIYVRIWREMKRHRLYMARNSVTGESKFYLSSVSEASSVGEFAQVCGGRPRILPGEEDDVSVKCGEVGGERGQEEKTRTEGKKRGSSCSDSSAEHQLPSVQSDTTLCDTELQVSPLQDEQPSSDRTRIMASAGAHISNETDKQIELEDFAATAGDGCYPNVQNVSVTNETVTSTQLSQDTFPDLAGKDIETRSIYKHTYSALLDSAYSSSVDVNNLMQDTKHSVLNDITLDVNDRVKDDSAVETSSVELTKSNSVSTKASDHQNANIKTKYTISPEGSTHNGNTTSKLSSETQVELETSKKISSESEAVPNTTCKPWSNIETDPDITFKTLSKADADQKTASKTPPKTEEDSNSVSSALKKADMDSVVTKRKVTQSRSVSEVKSHKATAIAVSVTVVFVLSFVPHLSLLTVRTIDTDFDHNLKGVDLVMYNIFLRSYFINSVTNPFIYGVLNSRFRAECLHVFRRIVSCRK